MKAPNTQVLPAQTDGNIDQVLLICKSLPGPFLLMCQPHVLDARKRALTAAGYTPEEFRVIAPYQFKKAKLANTFVLDSTLSNTQQLGAGQYVAALNAQDHSAVKHLLLVMDEVNPYFEQYLEARLT